MERRFKWSRPILFILYIKDHPEVVNSIVNIFAEVQKFITKTVIVTSSSKT